MSATSAVPREVGLAIGLVPKQSRRKLGLLVVVNMATAFLDLAGVITIGVVTLTLFESSSQSTPTAGGLLGSAVESLSQLGAQWVLAVGGFAALLLLAKSWISAYLNWRTLTYLGSLQSRVSRSLATEVFSRRIDWIKARSSQGLAWALLLGCSSATIGLLGSASLLVAEVFLLALLGIVLVVVDPLVTLFALVFFAAIAVLQYAVLGSWASGLGRRNSEANIRVIRLLQEALDTLRELNLLGRTSAMLARLDFEVGEAGSTTARLAYAAALPKYVYESALLIGAMGLGVFAFTTKSSAEAVGLITVFLAASTRILPSMLRLQNYVISIRSAAGLARMTFTLSEELRDAGSADVICQSNEYQRMDIAEFRPEIRVSGVSVQYLEHSAKALTDVDLQLDAGCMLALVGPTGSGKSTLIDVILGVIPSTTGSVTVSGLTPRCALESYPGKIAFLPQKVALVAGTVLENVALYVPVDQIDEARVCEVLDLVGLHSTLLTERQGLSTQVGEGGAMLSGGQRQRLGLARALYTRPRLLILDEATSQLDAATEEALTQTIERLRGETTILAVAHRLGTVRRADSVVYLMEGRVRARGTFQEVRRLIPDFDESAKLLGL